MRKLILFSALAVLGIHSFAQNFQPATIVTTDGKSVEGEINYKNWKKNPSQIQFRKTSGSPEIYAAKDLRSFVVSGDRYVSAIVDIDHRLDNGTNLTFEPDIIMHRDTVLLRALVTGTKSLYYYFDIADHFYILKNDTFELLKYKKYISPANDQDKVYLYNREFVSQLAQYLEGCESFKSITYKAKYDADNLKNAFIKYYECKSASPEFVRTRESEKVEIGVLAGASSTIFKVKTSSGNTNMVAMSRIKFSHSTNFIGGIFFDIVFPRQRGKVSMNNELAYSSYHTSGTYRTVHSATHYDDRTFEVAYSYIKMNNMLRYKFLLNNSAIFVNGGLSSGFLLKDESKLTLFRKYDETETTQVDNVFKIDARKFELGILAGAGFRKNRVSIELRVERGTGPLSEVNSSAHVYRYYALLGYRIK